MPRVFPDDLSRAFKRKVFDNRVLFSRDGDVSQHEMKAQALEQPFEICYGGILNAKTQELIGYKALDERPRLLESDGVEDLLYKYYSEEKVRSLDLVPALEIIRDHILDPQWQSSASTAAPGVQEFAIGPVIHHGVISLSTIATTNPDHGEIVKRISEVTRKLLDEALDEVTRGILRSRSAIDASLCIGFEYNRYTSSINVNLGSSEAVGIEVADGDDPCSYSVIQNLSSLPSNCFPGRFCITPFHEYYTTAPFTALVLKRMIPHMKIGSVEYDTGAIKYESPACVKESKHMCSVVVTSFPDSRMMHESVELGVLLRTISNPLCIFGTCRNFSEWLLRIAAVESGRRSKGSPKFVHNSPEYLRRLFLLESCKDECQPRESVAAEVDAYSTDDDKKWDEIAERLQI